MTTKIYLVGWSVFSIGCLSVVRLFLTFVHFFFSLLFGYSVRAGSLVCLFAYPLVTRLVKSFARFFVLLF